MPRRYAVLNAHINTMDPENPTADALLVEEGRIVSIGSESHVLRKARGAKRLDAAGRTILPGIIDSHTHLVHQGLLKRRLDLRDTTSLRQALQRVKAAVTRLPKGQLLLAERWDESRWKERRYPHREDLDRISQQHSIILRRVDGHIAVGNQRACETVAKRLPGVDLDTGLLVEEASLNLNQVFPTPARESAQALTAAQEQALRLGVTTVHDFVVPSYLRAYQDLHRRGRLRIRAHVTPYVEYLPALSELGITSGFGDDRLRMGGVKLFGDGSLGGHTAALRSPYRDDKNNQGKLNWTDEQLAERFQQAQRSGLQVSAHAIGDAAIDQILRAYARLGRHATKARHRIEHYELHYPEHDQQVQELGLVASMQPNFVGEWSRPGGMYHDRLGSPRHRQNNQFQRLRTNGVRLAFGSDCMPFDPWLGLHASTHAPYPSQRLRPQEALQAYTQGSAYALHREHDLGTLKVGAHADFIIPDWKPRIPSDLAATRILATFVAGAPEHVAAGTRLHFRS